MDTKITLRFEESIIEAAKSYAAKHNMSLSRLTEFLYRRMTDEKAYDIEDLPISDWINSVSEGEATYTKITKNRKKMKDEFFNSKK